MYKLSILLYRGNQKQQNKTVEIKMDTLDVQTNVIISGIELKCVFIKKSEYGTNQLCQVLDEKQLQCIIKLAEENLKMPVWKYTDNCYLKIDANTAIYYIVELYNETPGGKIGLFSFTKDMPYIMDLTFYKYGFKNK